MEAAFRAWWQESYGLPPGPHAVMTHVAWGEHLLTTRPKPLSPAAQAVLDAYLRAPCDNKLSVAAALRAAADQILPLTPKPSDTFCCPPVDTILWNRVTNIRNQLLAIAAELEAQP